MHFSREKTGSDITLRLATIASNSKKVVNFNYLGSILNNKDAFELEENIYKMGMQSLQELERLNINAAEFKPKGNLSSINSGVNTGSFFESMRDVGSQAHSGNTNVGLNSSQMLFNGNI